MNEKVSHLVDDVPASDLYSPELIDPSALLPRHRAQTCAEASLRHCISAGQEIRRVDYVSVTRPFTACTN